MENYQLLDRELFSFSLKVFKTDMFIAQFLHLLQTLIDNYNEIMYDVSFFYN